MPQLFLINSGVWEQKNDIDIAQDHQLMDPTQIKLEPTEENEDTYITSDSNYFLLLYTLRVLLYDICTCAKNLFQFNQIT